MKWVLIATIITSLGPRLDYWSPTSLDRCNDDRKYIIEHLHINAICVTEAVANEIRKRSG